MHIAFSTHQGRLFTTIQKICQLTNIKGGLCALFIHTSNRAERRMESMTVVLENKSNLLYSLSMLLLRGQVLLNSICSFVSCGHYCEIKYNKRKELHNVFCLFVYIHVSFLTVCHAGLIDHFHMLIGIMEIGTEFASHVNKLLYYPAFSYATWGCTRGMKDEIK